MSKTRVEKYSLFPVVLLWLFFLLAPFFGCGTKAIAQTREEKKTRISGQALAADGGPLMGVVAIETGRLYSKRYRYGVLLNEEGRFSVIVPEGGTYGLHIYATGYIYFPVGIQVKTGEDNKFTFTVPPNPAVKEAPVLSNIRFEPSGDTPDKMIIKLSVVDPNKNLSHQVLGINFRTRRSYTFSPPNIVFPWTRNYPNGVYSLRYDTQGRPFEPKEWLFLAADNRCYSSSVLRHPFTDEGVVPAQATGKRKPSVATSPAPETSVGAATPELGRETFANNCAICHYPDKEKTKVGPGLKGLFRKTLTPVERIPVTEENIRSRIKKGGKHMPPYSHIKEPALSALIIYLKSL